MKNIDKKEDLVEVLFSAKGNLGNEKYEVIISSNQDGTGERIEKVQGAEIICETVSFEHYYDYILNSKVDVYCSRLVIPESELKLSSIFKTTPYGIMNKSRTGVGATTLELNAKRNSVIVVPTQALAINKVEYSKDKETKEYKYLYVGGRIKGKKFKTIESYLKDKDIEFKKFIVVADSLPKLHLELGEKLYEDYFLMVDEIDSYQYDSHYRPTLENVIDYYFKFPEKNRSLVSATMGFFSNPSINSEPLIELNYKDKFVRNIDLIHTNNTVKATVDKINEILKKHPNDKILIAYNSISKGIQRVIGLLDEDLKNKCSVLCSDKSLIYVYEYFPENKIVDTLPNQINLMTSTYFVGVDIKERFHLISVSDVNVAYTLLSEDKYIQILGRCRHKKGVKSETIIYSTSDIEITGDNTAEKNNENFINMAVILRDKLIEQANLIISYQRITNEMNSNFPEAVETKNVENRELIERTSGYYHGRQIALVRESLAGNLVPAYFNIDCVVIQFKLLLGLYANKENLKKSLLNDGNLVNFIQKKYVEEDEKTQEIFVEIDDANDELRKLELDEIIKILTACEPEFRKNEAQKLRVKATPSNVIFLERFHELIDYVPFDELILNLRRMAVEKKESHSYNRFYNSVMFWALDEEHPLKKTIYSYFTVGKRYSNDEINSKMGAVFSSFFQERKVENKSFVQRSSIFFTRRRMSKRLIDKMSSEYLIEDFNPCKFNDEPLKVISKNTNVKKIFKF